MSNDKNLIQAFRIYRQNFETENARLSPAQRSQKFRNVWNELAVELTRTPSDTSQALQIPNKRPAMTHDRFEMESPCPRPRGLPEPGDQMRYRRMSDDLLFNELPGSQETEAWDLSDSYSPGRLLHAQILRADSQNTDAVSQAEDRSSSQEKRPRLWERPLKDDLENWKLISNEKHLHDSTHRASSPFQGSVLKSLKRIENFICRYSSTVFSSDSGYASMRDEHVPGNNCQQGSKKVRSPLTQSQASSNDNKNKPHDIESRASVSAADKASAQARSNMRMDHNVAPKPQVTTNQQEGDIEPGNENGEQRSPRSCCLDSRDFSVKSSASEHAICCDDMDELHQLAIARRSRYFAGGSFSHWVESPCGTDTNLASEYDTDTDSDERLDLWQDELQHFMTWARVHCMPELERSFRTRVATLSAARPIITYLPLANGQGPNMSIGQDQHGAGQEGSGRGTKRKYNASEQDGATPAGGDIKGRSLENRSTAGRERKDLACHYNKLDPTKYVHGRYKTCPNGYSAMNRLKQHLENVHAPEFYCYNCKALFAKQEDRDHHTTQSCRDRTDEDFEHMIITTERKRALKKKNPKVSDEKHWFDMWAILFPAATKPESPFKNMDPTLTAFRDYCEQQAPIYIDRYIATHPNTDIPPQVTLTLMFQEVVNDMLADFSSRMGASTDPQTPSPNLGNRPQAPLFHAHMVPPSLVTPPSSNRGSAYARAGTPIESEFYTAYDWGLAPNGFEPPDPTAPPQYHFTGQDPTLSAPAPLSPQGWPNSWNSGR